MNVPTVTALAPTATRRLARSICPGWQRHLRLSRRDCERVGGAGTIQTTKAWGVAAASAASGPRPSARPSWCLCQVDAPLGLHAAGLRSLEHRCQHIWSPVRNLDLGVEIVYGSISRTVRTAPPLCSARLLASPLVPTHHPHLGQQLARPVPRSAQFLIVAGLRPFSTKPRRATAGFFAFGLVWRPGCANLAVPSRGRADLLEVFRHHLQRHRAVAARRPSHGHDRRWRRRSSLGNPHHEGLFLEPVAPRMVRVLAVLTADVEFEVMPLHPASAPQGRAGRVIGDVTAGSAPLSVLPRTAFHAAILTKARKPRCRIAEWMGTRRSEAAVLMGPASREIFRHQMPSMLWTSTPAGWRWWPRGCR